MAGSLCDRTCRLGQEVLVDALQQAGVLLVIRVGGGHGAANAPSAAEKLQPTEES